MTLSATTDCHMRGSAFLALSRPLRFLFALWCGLYVFAFPVRSQILQEETLSGPDSHETGQGPHGHLFGTWAASGRGCSSVACDSIFST